MNSNEFREWSLRAAEWGADYRSTLRERPVRPLVEPGEISRSIDVSPPEHGETMQAIFADFERKILPGMTHWQHPRFFAYFPANAAPVSVVAEYLVSVMAAQCMLWQTSPAATELETRVVHWMRQALGLPEWFSGVMQDSASSATLAAVLTMRERALDWQGNKKGLQGQSILRVYSSDQVHTSIDRAIWVSGVGEDNLVRIPVAGRFRAMDVAALEAAVVADRQAGMLPAGIIACVGGTSTGGTDDIAGVAAVAKRHGLYLHVDAAWAGSAMICPEYRHFWAGVEQADVDFQVKNGERAGIRTLDLLIKSQLLYRLSYALPRAQDAALEIARNIGRVSRTVNRKKRPREPDFSRSADASQTVSTRSEWLSRTNAETYYKSAACYFSRNNCATSPFLSLQGTTCSRRRP